MNKFINKFKNVWYGLMYGLKITETEILTQKGSQNDEGTTTNQNVDVEKMSRALLDGKETQAVQELRYRTYKIADEASKLEYITAGLVLPKQDSKFISVDQSDDYKIRLIQPNEEIGSSILDELNRLNSYGDISKYIIQIGRNLIPRYRLEEFTTKLVVKSIDETHVQLDFYTTIYPNEHKYTSKGFISEINKIKDAKLKSDILEFESLKFITQHAYGERDLMEYKFDNIFFKQIDIFDGNFVVKFKAHMRNEPVDLTARFYNKGMEEKYNNKEKKDVIFNLSEIDNKQYTCSECGKVMNNDGHLHQNKENWHELTLDKHGIEHYDGDTLEFYDAQITLETYGKVICKDCLSKIIK